MILKVTMIFVLLFSFSLGEEVEDPSNETGSRFGGIKGDENTPKRSLEEILE